MARHNPSLLESVCNRTAQQSGIDDETEGPQHFAILWRVIGDPGLCAEVGWRPRMQSSRLSKIQLDKTVVIGVFALLQWADKKQRLEGDSGKADCKAIGFDAAAAHMHQSCPGSNFEGGYISNRPKHGSSFVQVGCRFLEPCVCVSFEKSDIRVVTHMLCRIPAKRLEPAAQICSVDAVLIAIKRPG